VLRDPVLRRWLLRRILGLEKGSLDFKNKPPPYLIRTADKISAVKAPVWSGRTTNGAFSIPQGVTTIDLPGISVELSAANPGLLFDRNYPDLETLLGAHRFAWVPLAGSDLDPDWVDAIWKCWKERFSGNLTGWPWHAYTAAERAINIIDFAAQYGLPGKPDETVDLLTKHASVIRNNLEYFGERYTSNHLSNNGRGLLRIGLALSLEEYIDEGARILIAEAGRIFGRSGLLKEGSSHYHLLITRNYIDAWLAADIAGIEQASTLHDISERAVAAVSVLFLRGGMPLIGDISPDVPPEYFSFLADGNKAEATENSITNDGLHQAFINMLSRVTPISPDRAAEDGWHRFDSENWQALAYVPPDGWPPAPGHGHQDLGSFELHDGNTRIIVDPGRGSYTDEEYVGAAMHNSLTIDEHEPMPKNRPYYDSSFRRRIVPHTPKFKRTRTGRTLGWSGLTGVPDVESFHREWRFGKEKIEIWDNVEGNGRHQIKRRYFTPASVKIEGGCAILTTDGRQWRLSAGVRPEVKKSTRWTAYGKGSLGNVITFRQMGKLPFEGKTVLERL